MSQKVAVHRWDSLEVEKITEMISRKIISGDQQMWAQVSLKRGAQVPSHSHPSEQMIYVLQGALLYRVGKTEIVLQTGEVLHVPSGCSHQAVALDDTFELDVFSSPRSDWSSSKRERTNLK